MTLFKRVFDSHFNDEEAIPKELSDQEKIRGIESDVHQGLAQASGGIEQEEAADNALTVLSRFDSYEDVEEPVRELSMAERAAQLHAQMNQPRANIPHTENVHARAPAGPLSAAPQAVQSAPVQHEASALIDRAPEPASPEATPTRSRGRVKTRLLGFHHGADVNKDPFKDQEEKKTEPSGLFPTGWLVVTAGPGTGNALPIYSGVSTLGRGDDQALKLDFGDTSISRQNHAAIAYDGEQNQFFLGHGGKSNIIRLNEKPVLSTEDLNHGDILRVGETTLRFVALCGADFKWTGPAHDEA